MKGNRHVWTQLVRAIVCTLMLTSVVNIMIVASWLPTNSLDSIFEYLIPEHEDAIR